MVPVLFLLVALPFASCGMPDMAEMAEFMNMMKVYEATKGWGSKLPEVPTQAPAMSMHTKEEYEAYLKWCEENKAKEAEQAKQQELLNAWRAREAERKKAAEEAKLAAEARERHENQMAQWKMWEKQMEMSAVFDTISAQVTDVKHKYYEMIVFEQLRFCRCSDFTEDVGRYFNREEFHKYEEFDIEDLGLNAVQGQNPNDVAAALNALSEEDRIKQFFGGLGDALCRGARDYIEDVEGWERQYNFLTNLQ